LRFDIARVRSALEPRNNSRKIAVGWVLTGSRDRFVGVAQILKRLLE
jgi:hypothetical protein